MSAIFKTQKIKASKPPNNYLHRQEAEINRGIAILVDRWKVFTTWSEDSYSEHEPCAGISMGTDGYMLLTKGK